jgi:hypothetical protein
VIDRNQTGFLTVGQRNRELLLGGADLCIAIHDRIASCPRTRDCVQQALQDGIATYGIENQHAIPGGSSAGIQGSIDLPGDSDPMEIGVRVDAVRPVRFFDAARGRVVYEPAITFTPKPAVGDGHDLEVSNPHRSVGAGVVILIGVSLKSLGFNRPQFAQCHLIQRLHSRLLCLSRTLDFESGNRRRSVTYSTLL